MKQFLGIRRVAIPKRFVLPYAIAQIGDTVVYLLSFGNLKTNWVFELAKKQAKFQYERLEKKNN